MSRSSFEAPVVNTVSPGGSTMKSHALAALLPLQPAPEQGFAAGVGSALLASTAALTWLQSSPTAVLNVSRVTKPDTPEAPCEAAAPPPTMPRVTDEYVRLNAPEHPPPLAFAIAPTVIRSASIWIVIGVAGLSATA